MTCAQRRDTVVYGHMLLHLALFAFAAICCFGQQSGALSILKQRCMACHSGASKKSGLDLSSRNLAIRGGDRGPAIVPGKGKESLLYRVASHAAEPHMPLQMPKLAEPELTALLKWIDEGAPYDTATPVAAKADALPPLPEHWSFRKPERPAVPVVANAKWVRNPIDAFVEAEREKRKLAAVGEAEPRLLLRRLYLDLVGVPPTRAELDQFLADRSPKAYEAVVDRLLADSRYGERWGRHWMDIWRYSDWYGWRKGNDVRNSQRFMWRWRDWIVEALNENKGYDRMILEMLAADEVAPEDTKALRATGFLARNYAKYDRDGWMQDAVDHTALGMLAITMKCARCHDHKYDPIRQEEYYRFRAFFEPYEVRVDRVPGETDIDKDGLARVFDADAQRPTYLYIRGDIQQPDKEKPLTAAAPRLFGLGLGKVEPVTLPLDSYYPDHRSFVQSDLQAKAKADVERAEADLAKKQAQFAAVEKELANASMAEGYEKMRAAADELALAKKALAAAKENVIALGARIAADNAKFASPPDAAYEALAIEARKAERKAGILKADEAVTRAQMDFDRALRAKTPDEKLIGEAQKRLTAATTALTQAREGYHSVGKVYENQSTGRRTALARWIGSAENPLTARVAVNHLWLRHFGRPLVPTVFDFGLNGKPPTHPALLDWLATEFVKSGWNMKAIHRIMVTSATYRMRTSAGKDNNPNMAADPENDYLWRMNPRRMEAEVVRDSILSLAGELDPAMGGPEIDETKGLESRRRSIYFRHSPDTQMEFLKMFDGPNPVECYSRSESVVPQQALALANSQISVEKARVLAAKIGGGGPPEAFVKSAFETILGRPPGGEEQAVGVRFLQRQPGGTRARENFVHVLLNHNDFVTIR
ncbi:MAG TPA: DUF1553 domain-containing protein [Bryobacteraceae bacterium]|nr:DUF1553 domain-containing protein [Bryobacteraceae bacterium]